MKLSFCIFFSLIAAGTVIAQNSTVRLVPYFSAVVVNNIDSSKHWYQSIFELKIKDSIHDKNNEYDVLILENNLYLLELLQLKGSLNSKKVMEKEPAGTKIQGHFKIGFKVENMDKFLKRLAALNINVPRIYTDSITMKRNFLITDPDGNLVQFFE